MPWFERQLQPSSIPEADEIAAINSWFPSRSDSMSTRWRKVTAGTMHGVDYGTDFGNWTLLRRVFSTRTVFENMVDFWSNHFHVPAFGDRSFLARQDYDAVIRKNALGSFAELLTAATLHPAMLIYLDNSRSVRDAPNENHGRELLELHTVGPTSGYSEDMVKDSAVILSGWTVDNADTWTARYESANHTMGQVRVLGFSDANTNPDGREVTGAYLTHLANHPQTARAIVRKLAIRFISDNPSESLVERLAQVFLDSGTDIRSTLRALVASDEFRLSTDAKVRTPYDDLVSTVRVLRPKPARPSGKASFANAIAYAHGADQLFSWPRPDGAPQTDAIWCSASRMLCSYQMHWNMSGRHYPGKDVKYRTPASWLPKPRIRFDAYVDHLSRILTGRRSTALILQAACEATGVTGSTKITKDHPVSDFLFPRLVAALLDSPAHMTR